MSEPCPHPGPELAYPCRYCDEDACRACAARYEEDYDDGRWCGYVVCQACRAGGRK